MLMYISMLVMSNVKIDKIESKIRTYKMVTEAKINHDKFVRLQLCSWKDWPLAGLFSWIDRQCKILFGPKLQLEKNWSEVLEKGLDAVNL